MKKFILLITFIFITFCVLGQEIFKIPEPTMEEKHSRMVLLFWANITPGIKFAKTKNISPYEYGTYYGKLFASNRNSDAGFIGYAQSILNNWAHFIRESDTEILIETESDSLLIFKVPSNVLLDFFGNEDYIGISAEEMLQMMNGSHEQISGSYGCTSKMILEEEWIVVTVKKNE